MLLVNASQEQIKILEEKLILMKELIDKQLTAQEKVPPTRNQNVGDK